MNVVRRMKLMGFNAIRIPFSFKDLYNEKPLNFRVSNCPAPSLEDMLNGITDPTWKNRCASPSLLSPCLTPDRQRFSEIVINDQVA